MTKIGTYLLKYLVRKVSFDIKTGQKKPQRHSLTRFCKIMSELTFLTRKFLCKYVPSFAIKFPWFYLMNFTESCHRMSLGSF